MAVRIHKDPFFPLEELMRFLTGWILEHVQGEDRLFGEFLKENKIPETQILSSPGEENSDEKDLWNMDNLILDMKEFDEQHKELIFLLQQANDLQRMGIGRKRLYIPNIIKKLFYYSSYHFFSEEEHMINHSYPGLADHRKLHETFISDVKKFAAEYSRGQKDLSAELVFYIRDWTINHILGADKEYKNYLTANSVE